MLKDEWDWDWHLFGKHFKRMDSDLKFGTSQDFRIYPSDFFMRRMFRMRKQFHFAICRMLDWGNQNHCMHQLHTQWCNFLRTQIFVFKLKINKCGLSFFRKLSLCSTFIDDIFINSGNSWQFMKLSHAFQRERTTYLQTCKVNKNK